MKSSVLVDVVARKRLERLASLDEFLMETRRQRLVSTELLSNDRDRDVLYASQGVEGVLLVLHLLLVLGVLPSGHDLLRPVVVNHRLHLATVLVVENPEGHEEEEQCHGGRCARGHHHHIVIALQIILR